MKFSNKRISLSAQKKLAQKNLRQCTKCEKVFPMTSDYFRKDYASFLGFRSTCKKCEREYSRVRYQTMPKNKKKQVIERNKIFQKRKYIPKPKKVYDKKLRAKSTRAAGRANFRAKQCGAKGKLTTKEVYNLFLEQKTCRCGIADINFLTIDHIVPLGKQGSNWISNIRIACFNCQQRN